MAPDFHASKKCPHCGQWSRWNQGPDDACEHCGQLLDNRAQKKRAQQAADNKIKRFEIDLIQIYPTDGPLVKLGKYIIRTLQISFVAIVSFILWLLALIAG